jgi:hypothetical protein
MVTNATAHSSGALFSQWRKDRGQVIEMVRRTRLCIPPSVAYSVENVDALATCARRLLELLRVHFQRENEVYDALRHELRCVEVDTARRQAEADQLHLLNRLSMVCEQLEVAPDDLSSWDVAKEKLDWLFDDLDQHQERECESIEWLTQSGCD